MAPQAPGSSTMGVKKSTVATSARSVDSEIPRRHPAWRRRRGRGGPRHSGRRRRTCARSAEPSLQAQPAPCESDVSRCAAIWSWGVSAIVRVTVTSDGRVTGDAAAKLQPEGYPRHCHRHVSRLPAAPNRVRRHAGRPRTITRSTLRVFRMSASGSAPRTTRSAALPARDPAERVRAEERGSGRSSRRRARRRA